MAQQFGGVQPIGAVIDAVIAVDADKLKAMEDMKQGLLVLLAKGSCKNITREEVHQLIDEIYEEYGA